MPPKGGIRQGLGLDERSARARHPPEPPVLDESAAPARRGGIRQRLGVDTARLSAVDPGPAIDADAAAPKRRRGIRERLNVEGALPASSASSAVPEAPNLPLNKNLKKKFASGRLSGAEVEGIFRDAAAQGATGTPTLASPNRPDNLQRSLLAA